MYPVILTGPLYAVVVGGGAVGERKVRGLLEARGTVTLISPQATEQLAAWAKAGRITWEQRAYRPGDLVKADIVFAATDDRAVNAQVARDAAVLRRLCNVADAPHEGSFHVPAVHRADDVIIAVSTRGTNPGLAKRVRDRIRDWLKTDTKETTT